MKPSVIAMIVVLAIAAANLIFTAIMKRVRYRTLQDLLVHNDYDAFFTLIDKPLTRYLFPEYNRTYFKLNALVIKGDEVEAARVLEDLLSRRLPKNQRYDLVIRAFNIYIGQGNSVRTKELLKEIESWEGDAFTQAQIDCRQMYEIAILKKSTYIEEMEAQLDTMPNGPLRGRIEYLLSLQYDNRGEKQRAQQYLKQAAADAFPGAQQHS